MSATQKLSGPRLDGPPGPMDWEDVAAYEEAVTSAHDEDVAAAKPDKDEEEKFKEFLKNMERFQAEEAAEKSFNGMRQKFMTKQKAPKTMKWLNGLRKQCIEKKLN